MRSRFCSNNGESPAGLFGRDADGPFARKRRGRRMFDSGALRLVVLGLIAEEPRHGYDIIRGLKQKFQGSYSPSPGAIYPILGMLEAAGLVEASACGMRRRFAITPVGQDWLNAHRAELDRINAQVDEAAAPIEDIGMGEAIRAFRFALFSKVRGGGLSEAQAKKIKDILARAKAEIESV